MNIRLMNEDDLSFGMELKEIAHWNQTADDWKAYLEFEPGGCFVAEVDGKAAGTATTITYGSDLGWIGMVLVHPERRRLGIGTCLLKHCIAYLRGKGIKTIKLDATPAGRQVYIPLGFRNECELCRYEGTPIIRSRMDKPEGMANISEHELPALIDYDKNVFGVARDRVLTRLHKIRPDCGFVAQDGFGNVTGYIMIRPGNRAFHLGPWAADDADTAEALLVAALSKLDNQPVFLDIPLENESAYVFMHKYGFTSQRPLTRMVLGTYPIAGSYSRLYATSSAEKG